VTQNWCHYIHVKNVLFNYNFVSHEWRAFIDQSLVESKRNIPCKKRQREYYHVFSYMCYFTAQYLLVFEMFFPQYPVLQPHLIVHCLLISDSRRRAMVAAVQLQDWHLVWHLHQFRWESCFLSCVVDLFDSHMFRDKEKGNETVSCSILVTCWNAG
jgi:hypothetical protein